MRKLFLFISLSALCMSALAQTGKDNSTKLVFEKAYLHTDRDVYAQGDTLWFKAYLVNAQDNKPINSSGNLYVELIAPDSAKILSREIIRLDNGLGNGDISLVDSLPPGKYRLRAYTNWMRNFGDNFVFEKEITLLNTQASPAILKTGTTKTKAKSKKTTAPATATPSPATPTVRFFPEGGSMVEGISAMIGVKAEDGYGNGVPVKGAVLSSAGDTVARFSCDSLGMGLLALLPVKGLAYHAVVNKIGAFDLPSALSRGATLQVRQTDSVIHAIISATDTMKAQFSVVVKHAGKTLVNQSLLIQRMQTSVKIPTASLPEGISAITLYNGQGKPECERLIYIHHTNSSAKTIITTNKKSYRPKEKVDLQISAPANSNLSVAVVDAGVVPEQADDIVSYLQLQSEVKGNIENARRYFDTTNINRFKQLDLLLMTQGWRDFVWRRLADTAIRISYAAENGIPIPGRIRDENYNKMLPNLNISLYADGSKGDKMFATKSDSLGRFSFRDLMLYGKQNVRLSAVNDKGESKGAFWVDTLLPAPVHKRDTRLAMQKNPEDSTMAVIVKKRIADLEKKTGKVTQLKEVQINDKYKKTVLKDGNIYSPWGTNLSQSLPITPKDYEYKTLMWYAMAHIYGAHPTTGPEPGILIPLEGRLVAPVLIINGAVQGDYDRTNYYTLPIDRFKHISFKLVYFMRKDRPQAGLKYLLFLDLREDYNMDNPGLINTEIEGYYQARTFYQPVPNEKPSLADYRTTIHWQPNIKTDATGKAMVSFYNAASQTDVRVIVEGISPTGVPLLSQSNYRVTE